VERVFLVYVDERLREELDRLSGYGFLLAEARYPAQDHGLWRQALAHLRATHPTPRLQGVPALVEKEHLPLAAADFPAYVLADYLKRSLGLEDAAPTWRSGLSASSEAR
jgi:hypothetical protein